MIRVRGFSLDFFTLIQISFMEHMNLFMLLKMDMVIMSMENYETILHQLSIYKRIYSSGYSFFF